MAVKDERHLILLEIQILMNVCNLQYSFRRSPFILFLDSIKLYMYTFLVLSSIYSITHHLSNISQKGKDAPVLSNRGVGIY